MLPPRKTKSYG